MTLVPFDEQDDAHALTAPCPHCVRGTVPGTNGSRWRCAACNGTGRIALTNDNARTAT